MPFWIHVALVVLGTVYFLYSYIKERKIYQLLFVIWIPLTLLTYLSTNKVFLIVLGIVQLLFFLAVIYFLFRKPNKGKGTYQAMMEELDGYGREETVDSPAEEIPEAETAAVEEITDTEIADDTMEKE